MSSMEKKHGLGKIVVICVAVSFSLVMALTVPRPVIASEQGKEKPPDSKITPLETKANPTAPKMIKAPETGNTETKALEMMDKGAKTFMEGFEMAHSKQDKKMGKKMMLEGHKMMANCEGMWAKKEKEFTGPQKTIHQGHAMMMHGYTMMKRDKDQKEGAKLIQEGHEKVSEGLKALQTAPVKEKNK
jgi:hypothetical protein